MTFDHFAQSNNRLERGETPFVKEAFLLAQDCVRRYAVDPKKYPGDFNPARVAQDFVEAERLEKVYEREDAAHHREEAKIAKIFEVALWYLTQQKKFLGEKIKAVLPNRFDDYKNKTDLILEIASETEEISRLGLAIDATFGTEAVEGKLAELGGNVEAGIAGEVRYYVSADKKERRALTDVPHVIVGLSVARARELGQLWMRLQKGETVPLSADQHPFRVIILHQIVAQTSALGALARSRGNIELAKRYEEAHRRISTSYSSALSSVSSKAWKDVLDQDYRYDPVYQAIIDRTVIWRKRASQTH